MRRVQYVPSVSGCQFIPTPLGLAVAVFVSRITSKLEANVNWCYQALALIEVHVVKKYRGVGHPTI
jgi:hypothetical protein